MTLHSPAQRVGIAICELCTLGVALALLTAPGRAGSVTGIVAATSVVVIGTGFWGYLFMSRVVLKKDVLVVRSYRRFSVPVSDILSISNREELRQPAVTTKDGRTIYLSPLVSPFANWGLGRRRTEAMLHRLAEALGVPLLIG